MAARGAAGDGDSDWDDAEEVEEVGEGPDSFQSLFSREVFASFEELRRHDAETFGFDVVAVAKELDLDFFGAMRLVNLVRLKAAEGLDAEVVREGVLSPWRARILDPDEEDLLRPALAEDALLWSIEAVLDVADDEVEGLFELPLGADEEGVEDGASAEVQALRREVAELQQRLAAATHVIQELTAEDNRAAKLATGAEASLEGGAGESKGPKGAAVDAHDAYYSDSYSFLGIHETMLRDAPRTGGYHAALAQQAGALVRGKKVLDVGCGTGVLSMFAARSGAAQVVGVDFSSMAATARLLVQDNACGDAVQIVHGKMEEVELPLADHDVDVIVSEWMGYALFYENMLASVLEARDKYLRPGGTLMPSSATMFLAGLQDPGALGFWDDVYGLDFGRLRAQVLVEPEVELVAPGLALTATCTLRHFDLNAMAIGDVDFHTTFELRTPEDADLTQLNAFVLWFDCGFPHVDGGGGGDECERAIVLKTGPRDPPTHWKQTILRLPPSETIATVPGGVVEGRYSMARSLENPREVDITVEWARDATDAVAECKGVRVFHMGR